MDNYPKSVDKYAGFRKTISNPFVLKSSDATLAQTYSYLSLRRTVGWIGILLPWVLVAGMALFFDGPPVLKTISLYYHSGMRDVFVGSVCAIALFMFFYRGYDRFDNLAGNLAGFFALGIALFPTTRGGPQNWAGIVHFLCATSFFLILSVFSLFLFTRGKSGRNKRKQSRNVIYITCGVVMISSLVSIILYFLLNGSQNLRSNFVFWAESIALTAFGVSWLTKGGTLYPDKKSHPYHHHSEANRKDMTNKVFEALN